MTTSAVRQLATLLGNDGVVTDPVELGVYSYDGGLDRGTPETVALPRTADDVATAVRWAIEQQIPVVARGAGTGLSGGAVAEHGGLVLSFARMDRVTELDDVALTAAVEPGVVNAILDQHAAAHRLYYPPDPSSGRACTVGGNIAENAGGPHCFKYGITTRYVLALDVVLADGRSCRLGSEAHDAPGYDLCGVVTGSEGTLAAVTSAVLQLVPRPAAVRTAMVEFDSLRAAGDAVSAVIAAGLVPAALELMDRQIVGIVEQYVQAGLPTDAAAVLIVDVDGHAGSVGPQLDVLTALLEATGARRVRVAEDPSEAAEIWRARKCIAGAFSRLAPAYYTVDATVPRSQMAHALELVDEICAQLGVTVGHVAHAGDGNLHPAMLLDPRDRGQVERVLRASTEFLEEVARLDGSITGEHGVGIEKREYMPLMHSPTDLSAMLDVKHVFDPHGRFNPGKMFPAATAPARKVDPAPVTGDIFTPTSADDAAAGLAWLSNANRTVHIRGAREASPHDGGVVLCTEALRGVHRMAPDDLYVTVGAGTPMRELDDIVSAHGLQVPLRAPWGDATVGGVIAANVNAPMHTRYGRVRDQLLATTVALADGRIVRMGRPVVKNVAGYDLPKLMVGSHGTLGLMIDVSLRLVAQPRARTTVEARAHDLRQACALASAIYRRACMSAGILVTMEAGLETRRAPTVICTFEGLAEDVEAEVLMAREVLGDLEAVEHRRGGPSASAHWAEWIAMTDGALVRVGVPLRELPNVSEVVLGADGTTSIVADVGGGTVFAHATAPPDGWLSTVRAAAEALGGYAAVMAPELRDRDRIDRAGRPPGGVDLMWGLKRRWDPADILGPADLPFRRRDEIAEGDLP